ncbi:MAG: D-alanine--D-alanine ligase [Planctomycetes bacterium]|nr:D-alanine--D-alanine ligase [Planctomycetota bacterium]
MDEIRQHGMDRLLNILVAAGGISAEREVSLASGEAVAAALATRGHQVRLADVHPLRLDALDDPAIDVVFIAMHGAFGEDGAMQQCCQDRGLPYVGSGPHASELAMDKAASKQVFRKAGLDTPDWVVIEEFNDTARQAQMLRTPGLPCVLKPVDGGSSVDIVIARTADQRAEGLACLLDKYSRALVERYVAGREFTVGVLGEQALPVMEIRPRRAFYDYTAKYEDDGTEYILDHGLDDQAVGGLMAAALAAHRVLGCRDMSRTDFRMDAGRRLWVLETNTIPGFTGHSLLPKAAAAAGIDFPEVCQRLVAMALQRRTAVEETLPGRARHCG